MVVAVVFFSCRRRATFAFFSFNLLQVAGSRQHATKLSKFHFGCLLAHLSGNENISPGGGGAGGGGGGAAAARTACLSSADLQ